MKLAIKFGLMTGAITVLWRYLNHLQLFESTVLAGLDGIFPFVILFGGIGAGIFFHRRSDEFGAGLLSFKEGAKTGVIISVIVGLCLAGFAMFFYTVINPDYIQEAEQGLRQAMADGNRDAAEIEKKVAEMKDSGNLGNLMFGIFTINLVIGIAASSILAAILKKEPEADPGKVQSENL